MATMTYALGAATPVQRSPQEESVVGTLAIVLGRSRAEHVIDTTMAVVEQRAKAGATKAVIPIIVGLVVLNIAMFWLLRRWK